jgi:hypothetical protein
VDRAGPGHNCDELTLDCVGLIERVGLIECAAR